MVVLSGYPSPIYDEALPDWRRVEIAALADGARPRTEVLWINPACAAALAREHAGIGVTPLFMGAAE
jgi:DNA adenine methylase